MSRSATMATSTLRVLRCIFTTLHANRAGARSVPCIPRANPRPFVPALIAVGFRIHCVAREVNEHGFGRGTAF
eukprot:9737396-Lingulodinium_polyedra.AAC.1